MVVLHHIQWPVLSAKAVNNDNKTVVVYISPVCHYSVMEPCLLDWVFCMLRKISDQVYPWCWHIMHIIFPEHRQ